MTNLDVSKFIIDLFKFKQHNTTGEDCFNLVETKLIGKLQ